MTFTEILKSDASSEAKLSQLSELVTKIRTTYGNKDHDIEVPYVNTVDGMVSLKYIDADSKLTLAERAIKSITIEATEACECTPGLLFDKEVEWLVATNAVLCNLQASTGSSYI